MTPKRLLKQMVRNPDPLGKLMKAGERLAAVRCSASRKRERQVVADVAEILGQWQAMFPSNPADTKQIFAVTNLGQSIAGQCQLALDYVVTGPHADFDYLETAEGHVSAARRLLLPNKEPSGVPSAAAGGSAQTDNTTIQ